MLTHLSSKQASPLLSKVVSPTSCPLTRERTEEGVAGKGIEGEEMAIFLVIFKRVSATLVGVTSFLLQEIRVVEPGNT